MKTHTKITTYLIVETIVVFIILSWLAYYLFRQEWGGWQWVAYVPVLLFQGLWFDRLYIVGHEATHRKLTPSRPALNDLLGMFILIPILVPLKVYRKIHYFHHGFNRKDHHTSVLDVFVSKKPITPLRKVYYYTIWIGAVFMGGYFIHSLVSVLLFLCLPTSVARRISPAFEGWTLKDQFWSWLQFLVGIGFHIFVFKIMGYEAWLTILALPLLAFAWVWSLLVYIFHYDTSIGDGVRYNVRSLRRHWFFSWLLMNFNEHATHHQRPNIPWYQLPAQRRPLPEDYQHNQKVQTIFQAIFFQLKGPIIVYEGDIKKGED